MPPNTLDIPCKTAAGHAELLAVHGQLSPWQADVLRLVDGRRSQVEVQDLARQAGAPRNCLHMLERRGLIVKAACVCLPGEQPVRVPVLQRARTLLMAALSRPRSFTVLWTLIRVRRARDVEALRRLVPIAKACLLSSRASDQHSLIDEAEGLLRAG